MPQPLQGLWVDLTTPENTRFITDNFFALFPRGRELRNRDVDVVRITDSDHVVGTFSVTYARRRLKKRFVGPNQLPEFYGTAVVWARDPSDCNKLEDIHASQRDLAILAVKGLATSLTKVKRIRVALVESETDASWNTVTIDTHTTAIGMQVTREVDSVWDLFLPQ